MEWLVSVRSSVRPFQSLIHISSSRNLGLLLKDKREETSRRTKVRDTQQNNIKNINSLFSWLASLVVKSRRFLFVMFAERSCYNFSVFQSHPMFI